MTRPLLEVADIVRTQGDRFIQNNFRWIHWAHRESTARDRSLPHGGTRWASRSVPSLWLSHHLL